MKKNFCTLFDKNYLYQGLALYLSLEKNEPDFNLYVLCMDEISFDLLNSANKKNLVPVLETEMRKELPALSEHKKKTTHGQYCWSCQPFSIEFLMNKFHLESLTYLEADSLFFSNTDPLFAEIGDCSASLVPHRYTKQFDQTAKSGKFCVQFNFFRDDTSGKAVLAYWKESCLQYSKDKPLCYPGQTTLDEWPVRFGNAVRVISHLGAGVAPWNVQQYEIGEESGIPTVNGYKTIFYHYHEFAFLDGGGFDLSTYPLPAKSIPAFYKVYAATLELAKQMAHSIDPNFDFCKLKKSPDGIMGLVKILKKRLRGRHNIYRKM